MITFESISFKNFLSAGEQPTIIQLNKTLTSIVTGINGAGKSTFIDAIVYCLFGKPFRKVKLGQLINNVNEKGLVTELIFTIGKRRYKVIRGMKSALFEIHISNGGEFEMVDQPAKASDYQDILENDILKLNYKSFTQIIILGSASFKPFMQLPLADRREIIEDLLDISVFSSMNTILKATIKEAKDDLVGVEHSMELTKQDHTSKRDFYFEAIEAHKASVTKLGVQIVEGDKNIIKETAKEADLLRKVQDAQAGILVLKDLDGDIDIVNKDIAEKQKLVFVDQTKYDTFIESIAVIGKLNNTIKVYDKEIESFEKKLKSETIKEGDIKSVLETFKDLKDRNKISQRIALLVSDIVRHDNKLLFYKDSTDCPECEQAINDDFKEESMRILEDKVKEAADEQSKLRKELEKLDADIDSKTIYERKLRGIQDNIDMINRNIKTDQDKIQIYLDDIKTRETATPEELETFKIAIEDDKNIILVQQGRLETLKTENNILTRLKAELVVLEQDYALCSQSVVNFLSHKVNLEVALKDLNDKPASTITGEEIAELSKDIQELDTTIKKKKYVLHYYGIVQKLLKDDGLKTKIIRQFLPIINATVNFYLDKLDFPINFEFDENFNESIRSNHRKDFTYHSFSEGEKARIDLSLLFSWRDIALKKSRNATNIIIFDEIFDGSLDSDGITNFMDILGVNEDGFSSFIISHKDDTINSKFDRNLTFDKDGHFSICKEI